MYPTKVSVVMYGHIFMGHVLGECVENSVVLCGACGLYECVAVCCLVEYSVLTQVVVLFETCLLLC